MGYLVNTRFLSCLHFLTIHFTPFPGTQRLRQLRLLRLGWRPDASSKPDGPLLPTEEICKPVSLPTHFIDTAHWRDLLFKKLEPNVSARYLLLFPGSPLRMDDFLLLSVG